MPKRGTAVSNTSHSPSQLIRREIKLPLQSNQYTEFLLSLVDRGIHPRRTYAPRLVHSIYLDTIEFDDYFDNVSGISHREKIRIRWYDEKVELMALEVKSKKNKVSGKRVIDIRNPDQIIPTSRCGLHALLRLNRSILPQALFSSYRLALEVEYVRSYFELSPHIRMTIDRKIQYRKLSPHRGLRMKRSPVDYVVEFKYPVDNEMDFRDLLRGIPFRTFRHSKYVVGMDTVTIG